MRNRGKTLKKHAMCHGQILKEVRCGSKDKGQSLEGFKQGGLQDLNGCFKEHHECWATKHGGRKNCCESVAMSRGGMMPAKLRCFPCRPAALDAWSSLEGEVRRPWQVSDWRFLCLWIRTTCTQLHTNMGLVSSVPSQKSNSDWEKKQRGLGPPAKECYSKRKGSRSSQKDTSPISLQH